jgi:hypothetical protein
VSDSWSPSPGVLVSPDYVGIVVQAGDYANDYSGPKPLGMFSFQPNLTMI